MLAVEPPNDDTVVDIPNSWWRDHLHVAVWILVAGVLVLFLRFAAEAVVPFVLSGMLFYALDPAVDALKRWRVPRAIGAALMLGVVLAGVAAVTFTLRDDVAKVVAELPEGARRLGAALRTNGEPSTLDSLRKATTAIDKTAAEAAGASTAPQGVDASSGRGAGLPRLGFSLVRVDGAGGLASQLAMVCFLAYFLLLADDLFKRKLVKHASSTLAGKKITVNVLEAIGTRSNGSCSCRSSPHALSALRRASRCGGWGCRTPRSGGSPPASSTRFPISVPLSSRWIGGSGVSPVRHVWHDRN